MIKMVMMMNHEYWKFNVFEFERYFRNPSSSADPSEILRRWTQRTLALVVSKDIRQNHPLLFLTATASVSRAWNKQTLLFLWSGCSLHNKKIFQKIEIKKKIQIFYNPPKENFLLKFGNREHTGNNRVYTIAFPLQIQKISLPKIVGKKYCRVRIMHWSTHFNKSCTC